MIWLLPLTGHPRSYRLPAPYRLPQCLGFRRSLPLIEKVTINTPDDASAFRMRSEKDPKGCQPQTKDRDVYSYPFGKRQGASER